MAKPKKAKPVKPAKKAKGAEKVSLAAAQKGKKATKESEATNAPAPPGGSASSTSVIGLSNLGNTCFFNSVLQVATWSCAVLHCLCKQAHVKGVSLERKRVLAGLSSKPSTPTIFLTARLQDSASTVERWSTGGLPASSDK